MLVREQKTMDGNVAAAHVSYAYSDVAAIYPITPSSTMAEITDEWAVAGKKNIFGQKVQVTEMQSEAGAAGAVHGSLTAGALTTTFTASQGLLLMIPNLYKIAGEQLPGVFNVAARAIATHALSIFGDHSDIYACRQTGVAMLASASVQEVMDLTPVAHIVALRGKIPFINFFDGFRTSHEMQKVECWDYETLKEMINNKLNTNYLLFSYYGDENSEQIIIAMGSVCQTVEETIDYLNESGKKTGLINVHLYRPFSVKHLIEAIPDTVKKITVLDRTKEPGGIGEPLYIDVVAALRNTKFHDIEIYCGRYGLGSKDTTADQINAVFNNNEKKKFTIGIVDDVTHLSLDITQHINAEPKENISCKFWGLGADGTVGANKNSIKIIGKSTDMYVQAYFDYDSKKSGGLTVSHLRFGHKPIKTAYLVEHANFVACHNPTYIRKYNMVQEVKDGGTFLLNCAWSGDELEKNIPGQIKSYIAKHNINFYTIDGIEVGKKIGLNSKINTILQSAFFALSGIIPIEEAKRLMKEAAKASYQIKGDKIVEMNYKAIDMGADALVRVKVPDSWKDADYEPLDTDIMPDREEVIRFVKTIQHPISRHEGDLLPVSAFLEYVDGSTPSGTAAHERRNVAVDVPVWQSENCIQCNRCSYVCPHAVIRPFVMTEEEVKAAPSGINTIPMVGMPEYRFMIGISYTDCTGCGSCAGVCPGKKDKKALIMYPAFEHAEKQQYFDFAKALPIKENAVEKFKETTVKGSQLKQPLFEYSGACAGCGENPYDKLVTQLYGDRMYIANATGCSSIWGNSSPSTPYTVNKCGKGPAWSNSLFEDAAEFGYGMLLAERAIRDGLKDKIETLIQYIDGDTDKEIDKETDVNIEESDGQTKCEQVKTACKSWLNTFSDGLLNGKASKNLEEALQKVDTCEICKEKSDIIKKILLNKDFLSKKSQWIYGGDGWAYDIGFGGLDHVLASGQDINVMVFDTEVYSNTGGQASKATPLGAVAKFEVGGKNIKKKDLGGIAMTYGYVYVAQIAMGADYNQTIKAITEAERYRGPSLIIAYSPCISHGIRSGMGSAQHEEKKAVESGYWHLYRYNPELKKEGKNPFILDSKTPQMPYDEFISGEIRYNALKQENPEKAEKLFEEASQNTKERTEYLQKLIRLYDIEQDTNKKTDKDISKDADKSKNINFDTNKE